MIKIFLQWDVYMVFGHVVMRLQLDNRCNAVRLLYFLGCIFHGALSLHLKHAQSTMDC